MAYRKTNFIEGEIYHVYNRGSFKHEIFHDREDYERFQTILYLSNSTKRFKIKDIKKYQCDQFKIETGDKVVNILSFVLMPNHFHIMTSPLIFQPPGKTWGETKRLVNNNLSKFMQSVTTAYTMYYNRKYKKTGNLFEGKFKAEHVDSDEYLKYLFAYIHLNPIKLIQSDWKETGIYDPIKAKDFLEGYENSSFIDYFINPYRLQGKLIDKESFLNKIANSKDLQKDMLEWLNYKTSL